MPRLPLFEGIIVRASGGRRNGGTIDIPDVPGVEVPAATEPVEQVEVEVEVIPLDITAAETGELIVEDEETDIQRRETVFTFHVGDYMRLHNAEPPFDINLVRVVEYSPSVLAEEWTPEDPFVTMDENGIITYKPKGGYLSNTLFLAVAVGDNARPPPPVAADVGKVYNDPDADDADTILAEANEADQDAQVVEINVDNKEGFIGDQDAGKFHLNQGKNPTCAITAVSAVVISENVTDEDGNPLTQDGILDRFTTNVRVVRNPDGTIKRDAYGRIVTTRIIGQSAEHELRPGIALYENVLDEDGNVIETQYTTHLPVSALPTGNTAFTYMLDELGVEHHNGVGTDFTSLVRELEAGNEVLVGVDSNEMWNNEVITRAQQEADEEIPGLKSRANHAVWITGIDNTDPDNPMIIINDSNSRTGSSSYPLDVFLSAWEDNEYTYVATGIEAPDAEQSQNAAEMSSTLRKNTSISDLVQYLPQDAKQQIQEDAGTENPIEVARYIREQTANPRKLLDFVTDYPEAGQQLLDQMKVKLENQGMPEAYTEFREDLQGYSEYLIAERERIAEEYGIDPEEVEDIEKFLADE